MISKIIPRPPGTNGRTPSAALSTFPRDLTLYVMRAEPEALRRLNTVGDASYVTNLHRYADGQEHEEVGLTLTRNLIADDPETIALELEARLAGAGLSNNYVHHFVLSWRAHEDYQNDIEKAAQIYLDALGFSHCPCVIGEHRDTDNPHLHLVVVPVDVRTGEKIKRYEYDKTRSQMATAVLCDRFGWLPEKEARYSVVSGLLIRDGQDVIGPANDPTAWPDRAPPPKTALSQRARKYERDTHKLSLERAVRTRVPALLEKCTTLAELDSNLSELGIRLARYGNGAAFFDGETHVKASLADRWSRRRIEDKFGQLPAWSEPKQLSAEKKPVLTARDILRTGYEDAKRDFMLRLKMTDLGFRSADFSDRRAATIICRKLQSTCSFPSFADWLKGVRPYDPIEVYAAHFTATAISPDRLATSQDLYRHYDFADRLGHPGLQLTSSAVRIDLVDSFIFIGKLSKQDVEHALGTLSARGHQAIVTTGFTRAERHYADRYARATGLAVHHARTAQEAETIYQALPRQRSDEVPPAGKQPRSQAVETKPSRPQPDGKSVRQEQQPETGRVVPGQTPKGSEGSVTGPSPEATKPEPVDTQHGSRGSDTETKQMLADWTNALSKRDPHANRLALLVAQNEQAIAHAKSVLAPEEFDLLRQNADAHRDFLLEAERRAQQQAGFEFW